MRRFVRLQGLFSRLLILVMLAAALLPALGHALTPDRGNGPHWVEVCTVGGVETRAWSSEDSTPKSPSLLVEHCPYCLVSSSDDPFYPQSVSVKLAAKEGTMGFPPSVFADGSSSDWPAAHPRAPPTAL